MARAVIFKGNGGTDVIELGERAVRDPGPGEVKVAVGAAGLNRADIIQRRGFYPAPSGAPADIPGLEFAGTVAEVGHGVSQWTKGQAVMGITAGGAMCEEVVVHARELIAVPQGMAISDAAAIPEVFLTAFDALFARGNLAAGQHVLIHSAASGIGTAASQLCRWAGATSLGTSRSADKLDDLARFQLDHPIHVADGSFASAVTALVPDGVDVVLDTIGASYLEHNLRSVRTLGRIVVIGLLGGAAGSISMGLLLRKRVSLIGTVLRARPLEEKAALARRFQREVVPAFEAGTLVPVVDSVLSMDDIKAAHQRMEANDNVGKIILSW